MAYTHKENRGSLFRADKQTDTDRDFSGTANIGGQLYWMSAWLQQNEGKPPYLSVSFKPQDASTQSKPSADEFLAGNRQSETAKSAGGGSVHRDMDDSIPFSPEVR